MKKIKLKLTHEELCCFIDVCQAFCQDGSNKLAQVTLFELWLKVRSKADFKFAKARSLQLTIPHAIAFNQLVGKVTLDKFEPFTLAVITPIYETINKQLQ